MFAYVSCIASYRMRTMRGNVMMSQLVLKNVPQNNPVNVPQNDPQNVPKNVPNHVFIFGLGYTGLALVSCIKRKYPGIVRLLCQISLFKSVILLPSRAQFQPNHRLQGYTILQF